MTEATTCPDFCRYLGEGRVCEIACGCHRPLCPNDDREMVRDMAALGEIRFAAKLSKKFVSHYKRSKNAQS